jgi:hypothetical protein
VIIALAAVIGFSFITCSNGGSSSTTGTSTSKTVTYSGASGGTIYTLKITDKNNKAVYTPKGGDSYELTISGSTKKSTGTVISNTSGTLTLKPSNSETTFTAKVTGDNLTELSGTITYTDNTTTTAPGTLTSKDESKLPEPVRINELDMKIYDNGQLGISFGAENSYTLSWGSGNILETGFYSWNTPQKIVILEPEKIEIGIGLGLLNKSELREALIEYIPANPGDFYVPPGMTIEEFADLAISLNFSTTTFNYEISSGSITYFGIKVALPDTGTTIAGCAYSQKAITKSFGVHYLLSISFDDASVILTSAYGQAMDEGWAMQDDSSLSVNDYVILEFTRYKDFRLHKSVSGTSTTKGWFLN